MPIRKLLRLDQATILSSAATCLPTVDTLVCGMPLCALTTLDPAACAQAGNFLIAWKCPLGDNVVKTEFSVAASSRLYKTAAVR